MLIEPDKIALKSLNYISHIDLGRELAIESGEHSGGSGNPAQVLRISRAR